MKLLAVSLYALILTINCFAKDKSNGLCQGIDETIVLKDKKTDKLKGVLICSKQVPSRGVVIFKDKNDDGILDKNDTVAYFISKKFQVFRDVLANKIDGFDEELKRHFEYSGKESTYYQIYIEDLIEVSNLKNFHKSILNPGGPEENSEEIEEDVSFDDLSVEDLYRQRYYSPKTGTFISPDPIGFRGGSFNLYSYVSNNPLNFIDPTGLDVRRVKILTNNNIPHSVLIVEHPITGGVVEIDYGPEGKFDLARTVPGKVTVSQYPFDSLDSVLNKYIVLDKSGIIETTKAQDIEIINRAINTQNSSRPYHPFGGFGGKNCFQVSRELCGDVCQ